jgi:DNA-binding transcriptional LysR family regulator
LHHGRIGSFLQRHPNLTVDLSFTDEVVDLLEEKADIAIRMGNLADSALKARKLAQRRIICTAPSYLKRHGNPQTFEDLRSHNCLTFNFWRSRTGWPFRDHEQPVSGNLQLNNGEAMKQVALEGNGLACLGYWGCNKGRRALVLLLEKYN